MEDLDTQLDEALDSIDLGEAPEDEVATESEEANPEEVVVAPDDQAEPEETVSDPYADFAKTGNPQLLPEGDTRDRIMDLYGAYTQSRQELSEAKKVPVETKSEEAPAIDLDADAGELTAQIQARIAYEVGKATQPMQEASAKTELFMKEQAQQKFYNDLTGHVRGLDGFSPEIEQAMSRTIEQHSTDPDFMRTMHTKAGLGMLFDRTKAELNKAQKQDGAAKRAEGKRNAPAPAKTSRGEPLSVAEKMNGLDPFDMIDKAVSEAIG